MNVPTLSRTITALVFGMALAPLAGPTLAEVPRPDRVVVFGTSLSDPGNAFAWLGEPENQGCGTRQNVPPFDALDDLLGPDGPYATGGHHVADGATWVEVMARGLARAGNARPALASASAQASNYATSGARAVAGFPCRFNLPDQVAAYLSDFDTTSAETLVVIEIGGNDVRDAFVVAAGGANPGPIVVDALTSFAGSVVQLYGKGARRFLVTNVPEIGKSPAFQTLDQLIPGAAWFAGVLAGQYNAGMGEAIAQLSALPGIDIRVLDIHTTVNQVTANPGAYGFANATDACVTPNQPPFRCKKPDTYVFWDGIHPTAALHALIAQQALAIVAAP
jgi:phospholipase/lecithinase/hemolysin